MPHTILATCLLEQKGYCVNFYTSQVATPGGEPDPEDYFILDVSYLPLKFTSDHLESIGVFIPLSINCSIDVACWRSHVESDCFCHSE